MHSEIIHIKIANSFDNIFNIINKLKKLKFKVTTQNEGFELTCDNYNKSLIGANLFV